MNVVEAARALGIGSEDYVRRVCRTGHLRAEQDERGRWQIPEEAVAEYRARRDARRPKPASMAPIDTLLERSRDAS